ncbi:MAG TPA: YchJ family protein [Kofleriaceae bacterium]|nr:YchJ family protein [Kofleriaceae bacterium]
MTETEPAPAPQPESQPEAATEAAVAATDPCPCGSGKTFADCCQLYLSGTEKPPTAEALMRSRYSAYVVHDIDYVFRTHDPKTSDDVDREASEKWSTQAEWQGMEVVSTEGGQAGDKKGVVEFIARYRLKDQDFTHHEISQFERRDGTWLYLDGEMVKPKPVRRAEPKVGRNEPCPCGSGKKYKKCHGAAA